ncbi:MAG: sigma-70 family RNA polymerase sigma factor [Muribaculaceae bacterium]|nr:sigma-70 family RNA polymerase sigma factor [Muribaculaceae bacterium]
MTYSIPPGFEGNHFSRVYSVDLIADILNEEKWEIDEISDRVFRRILSRKISRPIDRDFEKELFIQYREGNIEARNAIVYANLRLVNTIARHFKPHKLTCNDIVSEGLIGLLKAMDSYDIDSYFRFSTYAYKIIHYHIYNFLSSYDCSIVIPGSIYSLRSKYIKYCESYVQWYESQPSDDEIAETLDIPFYKLNGIRLSLTKPISLDHLFDYLGYEFVLDDLIDDIIDSEPETFDTSFNSESLLSDINTALSKLSVREADIIRKSFGIGCHPYTLDEIGLNYNITRERARQIREKAIRRLRGRNACPLKKYLND